ncbi:MAG: glyoxalase [Microscillaceae bacterium]|jgi:hypothetical protein|nr:glyoxalase [Microscillaceae bacterium]
MNRDSQIAGIRPQLLLNTLDNQAIEQFQNETLRPILKFQNDLLVHIFESYCQKHQLHWAKLNPTAQRQCLQSILQKDQNLRSLYLGTIVGMFTLTEHQFYAQNQAELSKRLIKMLVQRLDNQMIG